MKVAKSNSFGNIFFQEGGGDPDILQMVAVPKVNVKVCREAYEPTYTITSRMLCAGSPLGGKDACQVLQ